MFMLHNFPSPPIRRRSRINWAGVIGLGLMAISAGMMLGWLYGILELMQIL